MFIFKKVVVFNLFFLAIKFNAYAQLNEAVRDSNIKTKVIWVTEKVKLHEKRYKKQELRFNKNGFCIEELLYNHKGKIILHKSYSYNKDLLEREIEFDAKGFIVRRIEYKYTKEILTEKITYDGKGGVVRNEQMIYEYQD